MVSNQLQSTHLLRSCPTNDDKQIYSQRVTRNSFNYSNRGWLESIWDLDRISKTQCFTCRILLAWELQFLSNRETILHPDSCHCVQWVGVRSIRSCSNELSVRVVRGIVTYFAEIFKFQVEAIDLTALKFIARAFCCFQYDLARISFFAEDLQVDIRISPRSKGFTRFDLHTVRRFIEMLSSRVRLQFSYNVSIVFVFSQPSRISSMIGILVTTERTYCIQRCMVRSVDPQDERRPCRETIPHRVLNN